jgi:hypothetical protein
MNEKVIESLAALAVIKSKLRVHVVMEDYTAEQKFQALKELYEIKRRIAIAEEIFLTN